MSLFTIVSRIALDPDELHYILQELIDKNPDDPVSSALKAMHG